MVTKFFLLGALCAGVFGQAPAKPAPAKTAPAKPAAAKPNPTSEAALRARVSQFMQYHVEGKFSKAMELVAEDTKEQYFAGGKQRLKAFKLESVKLTDKNTKAVVTTIVTRDWDIRMQQHEVVIPMVTTWKVQKGQWFWYWDANGTWLTPMGPSKIEPLSKNPDGTIKGLPPKIGTDEVAAQARNILAQSGLSKSEVVFDPAVVNGERVAFTNGVQGYVKVSLEGIPRLEGFSANLESPGVTANGQIGVILSYQPVTEAPIPDDFTIQVVTEPLNQSYPIRVRFTHPQ